jgi:hypothetical protein
MTMTTTDQQPTLAEWLASHPVTMVKLAGPYESKDDDGWVHDAYVVRLIWGDRTPEKRTSPEIKYRMGVGHRVKKHSRRYGTQVETPLPCPPLDYVVDAMVSDAACYDEARDFADFAANLGYDDDSIKAERIYRECGETLRWLETFVGGRAELEALMYRTERL